MRRALLVALFTFAGAWTAFAQNKMYFPQVADGAQDGTHYWKTTIFLTNPGSTAVSGSITFSAPSGLPFPISFVDDSGQPVGGAGTIPISPPIPGKGTRKFVSTAEGIIAVGFATVNSTGALAGTGVFSFYGPNGLISEAGVPGVTTPVLKQAIVVDTTGDFRTGVAFASTGAAPLPVSLTLLNLDGVQVMTTTANTESPVFQTARIVDEFFAPLGTPPTVGTLQISSSGPLAAVGLRFGPNGAFTTLPSVTLASVLQPALQWFEQRTWVPSFSSVARLLTGLQYWRG